MDTSFLKLGGLQKRWLRNTASVVAALGIALNALYLSYLNRTIKLLENEFVE